jgi:ABC-2 type transport system ATP-binding protein
MDKTAAPLVVRGVRKAYGTLVAADDVSFEVRRGECFGLLGPNGAGKTTTLSIVATLLRPDAGEVLVEGADATREPERVRRALGLVPQELSLYEDLTADENLAFFGGLYGLRGADLKARAEASLALAGLADRRKDRVKTFSGGMKRRLNFAIGLVHDPRLVLLDEPTVGVDPQSRNHLFEMVAGLKARGTTLVYTTHYMEEAERLCDRVGIMDKGRLVAVGTRAELTARLGAQDEAELTFEEGRAPDVAALAAALAGLKNRARADGAVCVDVADPAALAELLRRVEGARLPLRALTLKKPDLETVFLSLTGRALRD